jgi:thioester reductase-like protein
MFVKALLECSLDIETVRQIVHRARSAGLETTIVRLGQICGDTSSGAWHTVS